MAKVHRLLGPYDRRSDLLVAGMWKLCKELCSSRTYTTETIQEQHTIVYSGNLALSQLDGDVIVSHDDDRNSNPIDSELLPHVNARRTSWDRGSRGSRRSARTQAWVSRGIDLPFKAIHSPCPLWYCDKSHHLSPDPNR